MRGARMSKRNNFTTGADNTLFIHLTLLPKLAMAGEIKTKPTQHSVKELRSIGLPRRCLLVPWMCYSCAR